MTGTTLSIAALGVRIDVDLTPMEPSDRARFRAAWRRSTVPDDRAEPAAARVGIDSPAKMSYEETADRLSGRMTIAAITENAGKLIMLHAAGLAEPGTGRTVAFVGPSGRGKTTVTRVLGQHWDYVSDETVGIDPVTLEVFPHPKPLSVKVDDGTPKDQVDADLLGLGPTPDRCTLAKVVLLERDPGHLGPPELVASDIPSAIGTLTSESSFFAQWEDPLGVSASLLAATGGAVRLRYADATDLVPLLPALIDTPGSTSWEVVEPAPPTTSTTAGPEVWQRADVPAIEGDGRMAVLARHDGRPHVTVLDGMGPLLWDLCAVPSTLDELVAEVIAFAGPPPGTDATTVVAEALRSLQRHGIVSQPPVPDAT